MTYKLVILNLWCIHPIWINHLIEMIKEWEESDFKTGLILHVGDDMKNIKKKNIRNS